MRRSTDYEEESADVVKPGDTGPQPSCACRSPVAISTFFIWGLAYGLLDVLNKHFQEVLHVGKARVDLAADRLLRRLSDDEPAGRRAAASARLQVRPAVRTR